MDLAVKQKLESYPRDVYDALVRIRSLIYSTAEQDGIDELVETLKWGEPSYISNIGSVIRIAWKDKTPHQYGIYFNCQTSLIETFKEIYGDTFTYEGNRAIIFDVGDTLPVGELSHCISMSLRYKKLKHLNLLGS